jgi:hypothetical protein
LKKISQKSSTKMKRDGRAYGRREKIKSEII